MTGVPDDNQPLDVDDDGAVDELEPEPSRQRRPRWLVVGVPAAAVIVAGAVIGGVVLLGSGSASASTAAAVTTGTVQQTTVAQTQTLSGTIAYTATQTVANRQSTSGSSATGASSSTASSGSTSGASSASSATSGSDTLTSMATVGAITKVGDTLYTVDEQPVSAMYGTLPAYRDIQDGDTGTDVTQLQQSLADLGYNPGSVDGTFSTATLDAVEAWQTAKGLTVDGVVHLGQIVFVPGPSRVIAQLASVGDTVANGSQILSIGPESPIVTTSESSTQLGLLSQGQQVDVQLPNNAIVVGKVTSVGATSSSSSSSSSSAGSTGGSGGSSSSGASASSGSTPVTIALNKPSLGNSIAGSSVNVIVTTATAKNVLAVPLGALLATSSGNYIVQTQAASGSLTNVSVNPTIYDDTSGIVAVPGANLTPGERVVVASS